MIHIYICEDNQTQLNTFTKIIKDYLAFEESAMTLSLSTVSPYELLKSVSKHKEIGLYFLDIDLQSDMDGLELAQQIRSYDPRGYIIFITTHSEMLTLTFQYKVEAMDFILKDQPDQITMRIQQCIKAALQNNTALQKQKNNLITFKIENSIVHMNQDDIILIESDSAPHKIIIHTHHGVKRISGSLKELENSLSPQFFRCHNSVLVNTEHIASFSRESRNLIMDNGETCPVSMRTLAKLKKILYS